MVGPSPRSAGKFFRRKAWRMDVSLRLRVAANPKLTPGTVLKIPEIPGLPLGRPESVPAARPRQDTPAVKAEASEEGLYANPALLEAKGALEKGDYVVALATVDQFLGQNPRNGEAVEIKRAV